MHINNSFFCILLPMQQNMLTFQIFFFLGMIVCVWSSCHYTSRQASDDEDTCQHPEFPGYKVKVGSNIQTPTCLNISCFESGISVCEFGWRLSRVVGIPSDCMKIKVGDCGVKFVKKDDEDRLCFEDKDLEYNSM